MKAQDSLKLKFFKIKIKIKPSNDQNYFIYSNQKELNRAIWESLRFHPIFPYWKFLYSINFDMGKTTLVALAGIHI